MLRCIDLVKDYHLERGGSRRILDHVNLTVQRGEKLGILGHNGAGKSTLLRLIGGVELPTGGRIERDMSISWPLGFSGAFQGSLSGLDNLRFICRIYDKDYASTRAYVDEFAALGDQLRDPVKTYSSGMRARLAFALSLVIDFDCYLIDEVIMVGDARFIDKCNYELMEKKSSRGLILVSHSMDYIRQVCDRCVIIQNGRVIDTESVEQGIELYRNDCLA
ncbi:ABC transporter ATP-binding protein [Swaminathania salitolerans]|uniref:Capsule polysaccharide export ATP-binding protein CtrD n=1 Tax=Swaminathania salitolerans TaxID=182838 RepID=A0A511BSN6_9PROT|nr:ABC transporter ATP-binding protein [Swaminathania salitolerans]GBQ12424.1 O-antigen ABC transporter ATP-binding protein [Swaminathania salitolerans LMG 21291]GEL02843.1 capsule polysaccharide export ATP-binding protein CtrD [Swaminathania salitolerans]